MNWVQRKIYLYNVTFGLYMLDWWERYLFMSTLRTTYASIVRKMQVLIFTSLALNSFHSGCIFFGSLFVGFWCFRKTSDLWLHLVWFFAFPQLLSDGLVVVLMWFVIYNGTRYFSELFKRHLT